jgi:hypothetical protein
MMKRYSTKVSTCVVFLLLSLIWTTNISIAQEGKTLLPQNLSNELKRIGIMIGQGKPLDEVRNSWRMVVERSRGINVDSAVQNILSEARLEADRQVNLARNKVQFYSTLKRNIGDELNRTKAILSEVQKTKTPKAVQRKVFELRPGTHGEIVMQQKEVILTQVQIGQYINELEDKLNSVGDDSQLANVDLQNALQKQQQLIQMISTISKILSDTAMCVIRKIGG